MLRAYQEDVVRLTVPDRAEETRNQLYQSTGLLELFVLLEQCYDVLESWVERIGRGNLVGDRLSAAVGGLGFGGLFQLAAESSAISPISALSGSNLKSRLRKMS